MINVLNTMTVFYSPHSSGDGVDGVGKTGFTAKFTAKPSMSNTDMEIIVDNSNTRITLSFGET